MFRNPQPQFLRAALVVLFVTLAVLALFYWLLGVAKYQDQKIPVSNVTVVVKTPAPSLSRYLRQRWFVHHTRLKVLRHQQRRLPPKSPLYDLWFQPIPLQHLLPKRGLRQ